MACDSEVGENDTVCPNCGVDLEFFAVVVEDKKKALDDLLSSVIGEEETKEAKLKQGETKGVEQHPFDLSELETEEKEKIPLELCSSMHLQMHF